MLEDMVVEILNSKTLQGLMRAFRIEDLPIESKILTKALDEASLPIQNETVTLASISYQNFFLQVGTASRLEERTLETHSLFF